MGLAAGACSAPQDVPERAAPVSAEDGSIVVDAGVDDAGLVAGAGVRAGDSGGDVQDHDGDQDPGADGADGQADGGVSGKPPMIEARGVWVTRWDFRTAEDVDAIMESVAQAGFNQVYFQVRGAADAYYRSSLEPWAAPLAGKLGRDPGWDPLQAGIASAHARGLELHAWINVCTGWKGALPPGRSKPRHLMRAHPGWRVRDGRRKPMPYSDGGYVFLNPAHPAFQAHLEAVVAELASYYAIDGLHLDYARYPGREYSTDKVSSRRFRAARKRSPELTRAGWQREELTRLVERLKAKVVQVRPTAVVSAAVTGIYLDRWGWKDVTQGKLDFYQDSHLWAERAAVDALIPMIYWPPTDPPGGRADFSTLAADFAPLAAKVRLLAGLNVEAGGFDALQREIAIARRQGFGGVVLFAYQSLAERGWFDDLKAGPFARPARAPGPVERAQREVVSTALRAMVTTSIQSGLPSLAWLNNLGPLAVSTSSASVVIAGLE